MSVEPFDLTSTTRNPGFAKEVWPDKSKLFTCIQCGTCTASCPTAFAMDFNPRQLLRMLQLGLYEDVLKSKTFWLCTTCYSCTVRCPRGISITETFQALKRLSLAKGWEKKGDSARFYETFMEVVRRTGRMHETETMMRWMLNPKVLKDKPFRAFGFASLGLAMLRKGKMSLLPPKKIEGVDQVQAMFDKAAEIRARKEAR
ncbi:MAG: 4Fe-4S dicluster domain-containing protein [Chloroflexia bacterium]|nr:4Fe-4S dicluster domain-containing protein [Chloroflexia bacterium]